ncbi:MAG: hypothetical protein ABFC42_07965 [Sulfuricella sp.]
MRRKLALTDRSVNVARSNFTKQQDRTIDEKNGGIFSRRFRKNKLTIFLLAQLSGPQQQERPTTSLLVPG